MKLRFRARAWNGREFVDVYKLEYIPAEKSFTGKEGYNINDNLGIPLEYLQRYTGLKDLNGKDIHEEDIVEYNPDKQDTKRMGVVEWKK